MLLVAAAFQPLGIFRFHCSLPHYLATHDALMCECTLRREYVTSSTLLVAHLNRSGCLQGYDQSSSLAMPFKVFESVITVGRCGSSAGCVSAFDKRWFSDCSTPPSSIRGPV